MSKKRHSGADDDKEKTVAKKRKRPCGLTMLPYEIISTIFIQSSNPSLPIVCKALYQQLYYCPDTLKIAFLMHRTKNDPEKALEEASRFRFFSYALMERLDKMTQRTVMFCNKKIPSRLFLAEPTETLQERDQLILALLERGASPNRPKGYPIIKSALLGRLDQVKLLVSFGADPTAQNNMALRACAGRNNREMVDYFLDELKVKPDSETLKVCVQKNLWDMFQLLVDHGAIPDMSTIAVS
ncbi:hypothetical protein G6F70_005211 [Rhizopus microsporus]|uniref:Uncharacterized protein n=2 Tax=Rhizopus TaxID=4842 RepID=A0A367KAX5_RHIAZ|nr:hypothetical protein G6F71_002980 [Rhizopus microsporus]RCH99326.1 hypothetical protein CU097_007477 [Rhizopus azygosporus]KAG1199132.1 hypothetical protein G6F70_005211 [Rhizopus microsporus]KAG1210959.1 hypothetical protein G6F69_005030 [Rhizopus microsporus]KAG1232798.1 hypothetical protein G6F67_004763 [Rhizopus microsporus]